MKSIERTLHRFDIWSAWISLVAIIGIVLWQGWTQGLVLREFLFLVFSLSPIFIFLFFIITRAAYQECKKKRSLFYFYLLITGQAKRLILEKLKDGRARFKHLHPKWRDEDEIVHCAVRQDLSNLAWCSERFREDLEFVVDMYGHGYFKIENTTIRDVYFAFLWIHRGAQSVAGFFWGTAIVKFFKRPDAEFAAERSCAELLFAACIKDAPWFIPNDEAASLDRLGALHAGFSAETYMRAFSMVRDLSRSDPPHWIW